QPIDTAPRAGVDGATLRWVTGPPGIDLSPPAVPVGQPMSITPQNASPVAAPAYEPRSAPAPQPWVPPDDIPDDAVIPPGGSAAVPVPPPQPAYDAAREAPRLGPTRGPYSPASLPQVTVQPAAKLACPMVSSLDRWVRDGVQP